MGALDHFHEFHHQRGVEEVHVYHFGWPFLAIGDEGTHEIRAVGGQDRVRRGQLVHVGEELLFHVEDFQ